MLLTIDTLRAIERGDVDRVFRRWKRPTVKPGGTLRTAVGVLSIEAVDTIDEGDLDDDAARRAGYADRASLIDALRGRKGELYRIAVSYAGPDPRIALRQQDDLDDAEWEALEAKLAGIDRRSRSGPWTTDVLELIGRNEGVLAATLADELGYDKQPFKRRVRRLKALGLTESLEVGYRLSPRGRALLAWRR